MYDNKNPNILIVSITCALDTLHFKIKKVACPKEFYSQIYLSNETFGTLFSQNCSNS